MKKIMERLYEACMVLVMTGIAVAAAMVLLKWLIDLGFPWACLAIGAGILIWGYASGKEKTE